MSASKKFTLGFFIPVFLVASAATLFSNSHHQNNTLINAVRSLDDSVEVEAFYARNHQKLFWYTPDGESIQLRQALKQALDSSLQFGLKKEDYHYDSVSLLCEPDNGGYNNSNLIKADRILTDAAIKFCTDLYKGANIGQWIISDEISSKFRTKDMDFILSGLLQSKNAKKFKEFINSLQPNEGDYHVLQTTIIDSMAAMDSSEIRKLTISLNLMRWINHFRLDRYVMVNIGSATLKYFEHDSLKLEMKVVVGKPSTRTPRFAAYCNEIILYPYWNVPTKIVLNELLPIFKALPHTIDSMNMQIIDHHGRIVDPDTLNWHLYSKTFFPYQVRQSTGCDNALGVIKFNLTSPFDVYMHDTNLKSAFKFERRYFSHGCIRLEKPMELANYLLKNQLDSNFLQSCLKDQSPVPIKIEKQVPVFVTYQTAEAIEGKAKFYKDVYKLLQ
ncbi:MAG TPA: L,D-transpeptidase family protein [Puia sp.]|nr:L,D-transpeptidase family protein [Puia sp.]